MTLPDGKYSLFCDSCQGLKLGLLDKNYKWIDYFDIDVSKSSTVLFKELHSLLEKYNVQLMDLTNVFLMMGPGSYTGIRLLQGMKDLYSTWGLNVLGFYAFEIPELAEVKEGEFLVSAYKGEFYRYTWSAENKKQELLSDIPTSLEKKTFFSIRNEFEKRKAISVYSLFENKSEIIFKNIIENDLRRDAFYFRPLEKEFNVSFPELR